jgi:DNA-directed RNA polymerase specialized sigma24 family protein
MSTGTAILTEAVLTDATDGFFAANADRVVVPFLRSAGTQSSDGLLCELIATHAEPVIQQVFRSKLRGGRGGVGNHVEAEDLRSDVLVRLLQRLRESMADPARDAILSFKSYVATTACNVCYEYLRQKYPRRWMLKRRVRHVLDRYEQFALWKADRQGWLCGLAEWRGQTRVAQLKEDAALGTELLQKQSRRLPVILDRLFRTAEGPLELDRVVEIMASVFGVQDQVALTHSGTAADPAAAVADPRADFVSDLERRRYLARLWKEILRLPVGQRAALLLNLRDGDGNGVIDVFPVTGIATKSAIASAVGMEQEALEEMWDELPLPDIRIAELLGLQRQQVINLRKAARARLGRRLPPKMA